MSPNLIISFYDHIIRLVYQYHNEKYIDFLYKYLSTKLPDAVDPIMNVVESFISDIPKEDLTI